MDAGQLRAAAELTAGFWLADPSPRERVVEMQQRAYELQVTPLRGDRARVIPLSRIRAARWWWWVSSTSPTSMRSPTAWWKRFRTRAGT